MVKIKGSRIIPLKKLKRTLNREQEKVEGENRGGGSGEGGGNRRKEGARMGSRGSWADWLR